MKKDIIKPVYNDRYIIRDKEAGNPIIDLPTLQEAKDYLFRIENQDRRDGIYQENFYEIYDQMQQQIVY